jgi:hypothetical protein
MQLMLSFACSVVCLGASVEFLAMAHLLPTDELKDTTVKTALYMGGAGLLGAANTALLFFCGTKKNQTLEAEETDKLIPTPNV